MVSGIIEYKSKEQMIKRRHYRMNCFWNILYQEEMDLDEQKENTTWFPATITDISGGGCRFNSERLLKQETNLLIKIKNPEKNKTDELSFKGKVIASQNLSNRKEVYETRICFIELSFEKQEKLIRWIFEEKRKLKWQERGFINEEKYFDY